MTRASNPIFAHPPAVLTGRVGEGQGLASGKRGGGLWLRAPLFARLLGVPRIYTASINVYVSVRDRFDLCRERHPYFREEDEELRQEGVRKKGYLLARPCLVNGDAAFVLRTEHPGPRFKGKRQPPIKPPHTMFEVVATKKLRWVRYGAPVELLIDLKTEPMMLHGRRR